MRIFNSIFSTYRTYSNMSRMRKILGVFFRNGFGIFFGKLRKWVSPRDRNATSDGGPMTLPQRLRMALEELGPVYVKVGQMLSTRPDLIGQAFAAELSKLQDQVATPFPFEQVRQTLEQELGAPLTEIFAEFEETPTAAASLAQGHRARLKDGTSVFVKVQRPNVMKSIKADLGLMIFLADQVHKETPELRFLMLPKVLRQFRDVLMLEADFSNEKGNIHRFAQQFQGEERLVVPKVYDQYCTPKILTMEFIDGIKIDQIQALKDAQIDTPKLSELLMHLMLKQFFTFGFFHADPHPGNLFGLPGDKLCYLDFGLCGRITREERFLFCRLIVSILEHNEQHAAQLLLRLCDYETEPDIADVECVIGEFIDRYFYGPLSQLNVPGALQQIYVACNRLRIAMRPNVYLLVKALGTVDGFMRKLNPDYDLDKHLRPALMKVAITQFSPHKSLHQRVEDLFEILDLVSRGPANIRNFTTKLLSGQLTFRQEFPQLEEYMRQNRRSQAERTTAILTVGVLLNSTLLLAFHIPPLWGTTSLLGAIGLTVGILMAAFLVLHLMRNP